MPRKESQGFEASTLQRRPRKKPREKKRMASTEGIAEVFPSSLEDEEVEGLRHVPPSKAAHEDSRDDDAPDKKLFLIRWGVRSSLVGAFFNSTLSRGKASPKLTSSPEGVHYMVSTDPPSRVGALGCKRRWFQRRRCQC